MTFAVIIATYGEDSWERLALERALPSAENQGAHEILVGHDPEGTIAQVRNALARKATSEWLVFLDADDELAPGYLEAMRQAARPHALLTPIVRKLIRGRGRSLSFYPQIDLRSGNWLVVGTALERELFLDVGGFEDLPHGFEDWSIWSKCHRLGAEVVRVRHAIYMQHVNPNSKHRQGWRNKNWQVETHESTMKLLDEWEAARS